MSYPIRRYNEDRTGRNPANFIANEEHILGPKRGQWHPIAPLYGPYFYDPETLLVTRNGVRQNFDVDFKSVNLVNEPSMDTAGNVMELLMLKNFNQGDRVTISYQTLGGPLQNNMKSLVDLYNAFLNDNRPVDWVDGILNKPDGYRPMYHLQLLNSVVGWENVIIAIERLGHALCLQHVPAFDALIDWVEAKVLETVSEEEIRNARDVNKSVTMRRLLYAQRKLHFNAMTLSVEQPTRKFGMPFTVHVKSTFLPDEEKLFWTIKHMDTTDATFDKLSGSFTHKEQESFVRIYTKAIPNGVGSANFRVEIRRESVTGPVIAYTRPLTVIYSYLWDFDYGKMNNGVWTLPSTLHSGLVDFNAESAFLIPDDTFYGEWNHG